MMMGSGRSATRFYAQGAPRWWPFQLVSLANQRLPPKRYGFYSILVDNGMWAFGKDGGRPDLDKWYHRLLVFVRDVERLRRPEEIVVVLPDWLGDFDFTLEAARHPLASRLCRDYHCLVVVHTSSRFLWAPEGGSYGYAASIYASLDYVHGLAAPLKLPCLKYDSRARRRIVDRRGLGCQLNIILQVCSVARKYSTSCHGLGLVLDPIHVRKAVEAGLGSFDSTSWTRPNQSVVKRYLGSERIRRGEVSAKTMGEKELFFLLKLAQLVEAGVSLESPEVSLLVGEKLRFTCFL